MSQPNGTPGIDVSGLRERLPQNPDKPQKAESAETAQKAVQQLNEQEAKDDKKEEEKKTFGRTPDGTGEYAPYSRPAGLACPGCICTLASHSLDSNVPTSPPLRDSPVQG